MIRFERECLPPIITSLLFGTLFFALLVGSAFEPSPLPLPSYSWPPGQTCELPILHSTISSGSEVRQDRTFKDAVSLVEMQELARRNAEPPGDCESEEERS